jgi:uncharacterized membrane protein
MDENVANFLYDISHYIELISFAIMIYGSALALLHLIKCEFKRLTKKFDITIIDIVRHDFAYYILLGLEFLIAADIIQTILKPTSQELIELGGIVVIRILLSYFLNKEMEALKKPEHVAVRDEKSVT